METINKEQLANILANIEPCSLTITMQGEVNMNKKDNPFFERQGRSFVPVNKVTSITSATYDFGYNYADKVNESLSKSPETADKSFESNKLPWGEWFVVDRLIKHNEKMYVRVYPDKTSTTYTEYFVDGVPATTEQINTIKNNKVNSGGSAKQTSIGIATENLVIPNNICFDKISEIIINGISYKIS